MKKIKQELEERGLLYQYSGEGLFDILDQGKGVFYCGFDPTASSLHLGNFIGFMVAVHLMRRGNQYTALVGGATGMIGDPGGKESERTFLSAHELQNNEKLLQKQVSHILDNLQKFTGEKFHFDFVNNKEFYTGMSYLDFLKDVGKYITVNVMISKDNVKKRIEDPLKSISYTEFSYMLLQGYDFCKLHRDKGANIQIGGSDQWGNLVTGTELIRKKYDTDTYVFTWPLITDASGKKFGKSEGNALFLDKELTSPYKIYQYFINMSDENIGKYFKVLTLLDTKKIEEILSEHFVDPSKRRGQKVLAYYVVEIIHSHSDAETARKISELLFGNVDKMSILKNLNASERESFFRELGGGEYAGENLFEMIVKAGLAQSHSQVRQAIESGSLYIGEEKVVDFGYDFSNMFLENGLLLIRKGKKQFRIIKKI